MYLLIYSRNHRNCSPSPYHYSWCLLHTGLVTECVCQYISETMRTMPLHHDTIHGVHYIQVYRRNVFNGIFQRPWELFSFTLTLLMMFITCRYTDKMCSTIYFRDYGNCAPTTWRYSRYSLHMGILTECVYRYILGTMETIHFSMRK